MKQQQLKKMMLEQEQKYESLFNDLKIEYQNNIKEITDSLTKVENVKTDIVEPASSHLTLVDIILGISLFAGIAYFVYPIVCSALSPKRKVPIIAGICKGSSTPRAVDYNEGDIFGKAILEGNDQITQFTLKENANKHASSLVDILTSKNNTIQILENQLTELNTTKGGLKEIISKAVSQLNNNALFDQVTPIISESSKDILSIEQATVIIPKIAKPFKQLITANNESVINILNSASAENTLYLSRAEIFEAADLCLKTFY